MERNAPLFVPGETCWQVTASERITPLIDGEEYFATLRRTLIAARHQILILGWDLHSQLELVREPPDDGLPTRLGELLHALLERTPELEAWILLWDYAPIYALEREPLLFGIHPWRQHPRLHFALDDTHPVAASHHQKLVVIDETLACCGGFDLGKWRWDSSAHRAEDARRRDPDGEPYPPFHDLQLLVDGESAGALAELARARWARLGTTPPVPSPPPDHCPWPAGVEARFHRQRCAIARTQPTQPERNEHAVREVEQLYLALFARAERLIYVENQYLTSTILCSALCERLDEPQGPEVVIVLPRETGAWLEQHTMDILRARQLERLRAADRHDRLRVYAPEVPGLEQGCLMVHAKLAIVDDRWLRIGSANLSNRSMGLDTECDLCIEAEGEAAHTALVALRRELIGNLLGCTPRQLAEAEADAGGLIGAIDAIRAQATPEQHTLVPLTGEVDPEWERQLPDERLIDPPRPLSPVDLGDAVLGRRHLPHARRRLRLGMALIGLLAGLALLWRWGLGEALDPQLLATRLTAQLHAPWGPALLLSGFVIGSLLAVPVTLLILVTALVYGPLAGAGYALFGALLAALAAYAIGAYLGRPTVDRLAGGRIHRLSERLARRGILTIVAVRIVPVAPFTLLNLLAGASHIRLRDYVIGTLVGMLPGVAAMAVFAEGLMALLRRASPEQFLLLVLALALILGLGLLARRLLGVLLQER
ncbi:VTT domain-containing protein [Marichromatium bheemlicum]|uniref:Phosphatidylserine/phosphatidylglycerophosphate/ cardiolipin synthase n=1 Tax=Marichromatium bheemlicum TaxID=365339 RepID=A0ABX1IA45_9GAMM|nr:VTT domain-containing protein [Marichromatium bheemlicum]NKN33220.1 phosphatidylserine/phosphatidylglycerophosphate/cardiolipin synthase [Marichromatium bheemlicum]